ncbi:hypothetical protein TVAG_242860 [Trichomonas vaginalis G3]|uniref:Profilin n=1 Tax=Trichomonas vaginalis (strain ATCC PRA-98 / G3) TaxID=412133 RepID=A2F845_TRIV3|nr:profilin (actin-binding protein) family [Trichomonas vaginalis G3]EAX98921.1 hypothetical protein TVAG_242860 [Trichomonas vaginalis G3]KAI5526702.1 profilin (actin-binding protein) family [Trichomonas vaginalis G3]|eukprot:XP_001311851.1 hypothetical protein [Trichomonas vaginalis G3]
MSWTQFIDLLGTNITSAGIFRFDGESLAATKDFSITPEETVKLLDMYNKGSAFLSETFTFKGVEYSILRADSENIQMRYHSAGLMVSKCKSCFIFAYHTDRVQAQNCYEAVVHVANILRSYGY